MRVVLKNVCKDIKGARVLDNVNLELESGRVYGFKGKNGSGKTMLMRAISGLIKVKGEIEIDGKIIGTGSISSFWGSETESILLSIFVLPEFHGKGVGRKIINTLETDEFYVRASRIEIPASITATEFYRKFGYDYKNGVKELDNEHHYRLEKFKEAGLK